VEPHNVVHTDLTTPILSELFQPVVRNSLAVRTFYLTLYCACLMTEKDESTLVLKMQRKQEVKAVVVQRGSDLHETTMFR